MHPTTFDYKTLSNGAPITLDFHPPNVSNTNGEQSTAAVVYFHAGGLHVGNKSSIPRWLYTRVTTVGWALISVNYQLLPPATGHDIIKDIQDLFVFLAKETLSAGGQIFKVDTNKIIVAGSSAGGYCALLAAMHAVPKPKVILSIYPTGANFLRSRYVVEKTEPFFFGRDLVDPREYRDLIYPFPNGPLEPTSDVPVAYGGPPTPMTNRRGIMTCLYLQIGTSIDYVTGQHEPSLSGVLRQVLLDESKSFADLVAAIPEEHKCLFPQLAVDANWPPTIMMTGMADTAVLPEETYHFYSLLERAKVRSALLKIPDVDHLFDFAPDAEEKWGEQFDLIIDFIRGSLQADAGI